MSAVVVAGIDIPGTATAFYSYALYSAGAIVFLAVRRTPMRLAVVRSTAWAGLALAASVAAQYNALRLTSVVNASMIITLQPLVVGAAAVSLFGERFRRRDIWLALIAVAGVVVVVAVEGDNAGDDWRGDSLALLAMLTWSAYTVAAKRSTTQLSSAEFIAAAAIWVAAACSILSLTLGYDVSWPSWSTWWPVTLIVVASLVLGHSMFNWSLRHVPLWVGATLVLTTPVVSGFLAWASLGETLTVIEFVAMAAVTAPIVVIVFDQQRTPAETKAPAQSP